MQLNDLTRYLMGEKLYFQVGYGYLYLFHHEFRSSIKKLHHYKNYHLGQRCFILGNGPSLNQMDLSLLRNEFTFGLNRIYLMFPKIGFPTTYLVSVNKYVVEQFGDELVHKAPCPKFISYDARHWIKPDPMTTFIYSREGPHFYQDVSKGVWQGATVTYVALQIAFHMGFNQVILIGVDHDFSSRGKPHELVTSDQEDTNHFDPNYFGKGVRWQLPDLKTSELSYRIALETYNQDHRQVYDATVGGKLDIFPKVDYESLF